MFPSMVYTTFQWHVVHFTLQCSGHSGQQPLPPVPGPTSEHSQNTHTAGWPSPCPQQALSNGTEEMSSPYSVSEYKVPHHVWIEHHKLLPLLYTSPLRPQEVIACNRVSHRFHTQPFENKLKFAENHSATRAALLCCDFFSAFDCCIFFMLSSAWMGLVYVYSAFYCLKAIGINASHLTFSSKDSSFIAGSEILFSELHI